MNAQTDIPRLVRELRERTGLTQEKYAAMLGVTFPTINRGENSRARPSPLTREKLRRWYATWERGAAIYLLNSSAMNRCNKARIWQQNVGFGSRHDEQEHDQVNH